MVIEDGDKDFGYIKGDDNGSINEEEEEEEEDEDDSGASEAKYLRRECRRLCCGRRAF